MQVVSEDVVIEGQDGTKISACVSRPATGRHPGVIVIHEIFGLNPQIRGVAKRYADEGFVALAPHLFSRFGDFLTEENITRAMKKMWALPPEKRNDEKTVKALMDGMPEEDRKLVSLLFLGRGELDRAMVKDLLTCTEFLRGLNGVRGEALGITGFCMGGGLAYQLSTLYPFGATVPFYGANPTPLDSVANIAGPVFGIYAGEDERVNSGIPALMENMVKHKKAFEVKLYKGMQHAFFNETRPIYDKAAADDAWERTISFFRKNLGT
jgi:carboxymethylenebutenolidase